jgi:HemK-like putative methylase
MNNIELPEAYRIGWVPFINTKIYLDSHPLIPRTETEYWANEVIETIRTSQILNPKSIKVLDLCAGSGCIGVAVAKELPNTLVDFVELDTSHHSLIRANSRINGIKEDRIRVYGGNLFEQITDSYDMILTNPPYVDQSLGRVEESVRSHEPALALYGGTGGLEVIDQILTQAGAHLSPGGVLWLEHEPEQVPHLAAQPGYVGTYPDQYGVLRFSTFHKD